LTMHMKDLFHEVLANIVEFHLTTLAIAVNNQSSMAN